MVEAGEIELLRKRLAQQEKENARLRSVIRLLAAPPDDDGEGVQEMEVDEPVAPGPKDDEALSTTSDEDEETPVALWDENDRIYRCADCWGEIDDGVCINCEAEHVIEAENEDYDSFVVSASHAFSADRVLAPRGTTPLLGLDEQSLAIPLRYKDPGNPANFVTRPAIDRSAEYIELRRRGATREMCEEFSLEFTDGKGIMAWANQDLMDEFAGPAMQEGDKWKIYLGRRVQLDEEDLDGTSLIEDILEGGVLFYPKGQNQRWVTVKENGTSWATMPNPALKNAPTSDRDTDDEDEDEGEGEEGEEEPENILHALQNAYDSEDDDDGKGGDDHEVKQEEDEQAARLASLHPTEFLGISVADTSDSDMEWEKESTDPSSCDSDFYSD